MSGAKHQTILPKIKLLIQNADKDFLKSLNTKNKLFNALSNELFFYGAFTEYDLEQKVKPLLKKEIDMLYEQRNKVLKGERVDADCAYVQMIQEMGVRIKRERTRRHYSQQSLAKKAGTTQQVLSRIESGKDLKQPTIATYHKLVLALGLKMEINIGAR